MGRLSEYDEVELRSISDPLRSNERDEYLTRAYTDGRNAARNGKLRTEIPDFYVCDSLAAINWECGWDDYQAEQQDDFDIQRRPQR